MVRWNAILPFVLVVACGLILGCPEKPKEPTPPPTETTVTLEPPIQQPIQAPVPPVATAAEAAPGETETVAPSETTAGTARPLPKDNYAKKPAAKARTYKVKPGDTLQSISKKYYNDSRKWRTIYEANRRSLKDPNKLPVGKKLIVP